MVAMNYIGDDAESKWVVLEVFGIKFKVSNPGFAELLTMDASEAMTKDIRELINLVRRRQAVLELAEAVPDVVVALPTAREKQEARMRRDLRKRLVELGGRLEFSTTQNGSWESSTGVNLATRIIERPISYAAAAHFVRDLASRRESMVGSDGVILFVTAEQTTADALKVGIRQGRQCDFMRAISLEDLEEIVRMYETNEIDQAQVLVLITPAGDVDAEEDISVIQPEGQEPSSNG